MRPVPQATRAYICLPCLLKNGRSSFSTGPAYADPSTEQSASSPISPTAPSNIEDIARGNDSDRIIRDGCKVAEGSTIPGEDNSTRREDGRGHAGARGTLLPPASGRTSAMSEFSAEAVGTTPLAESTRDDSAFLPSQAGATRGPDKLVKKTSTLEPQSQTLAPRSLTIYEALKVLRQDRPHSSKEDSAMSSFRQVYEGRSLTEVLNDVSRFSQLKPKPKIEEEDARKHSILPPQGPSLLYKKSKKSLAKGAAATGNTDKLLQKKKPLIRQLKGMGKNRRQLVRKHLSINSFLHKSENLAANEHPEPQQMQAIIRQPIRQIESKVSEGNPTIEKGLQTADKEEVCTLDAKSLVISPIEIECPPVPGLSHDLSRVLFNPGIYQLQDPRSRVFNFNPYLQRIMPVNEFNFEALKEYITSSKDELLRGLALQHGKKYVGSSSSMTSVLGHFHFLLSQWREINTVTMSRGFTESLKSFTVLQRSPSAIFLRHKDGVYAIDADKAFDSGNVLMALGKSMEKLLTLEVEDFERYRKSSTSKITEEEQNAPESYHYSEMGDFLMRSQLDAYDPRLPGSGMFDLKTRAVVAIRMNVGKYEQGTGYQIKERFGDWESYEREFFDMIRSAFLKYSLQVRMGRMDGIFVAFHNIERIFGFQYISLPEMDLHVHGQSDTTLGDQEFQLSLGMMNEVLNRAVARFPGRSLRFHFETRDTVVPLMYIFAEPMDDEKIQRIQDSTKQAMAEYETGLFSSAGPQEDKVENSSKSNEEKVAVVSQEAAEEAGAKVLPSEYSAPDVVELATSLHSVDEDVERETETTTANGSDHQAEKTDLDKSHDPLLAMTLTIRNKVNGKMVQRPVKLGAADDWSIDYTLTEVGNGMRAWTLYRACQKRRENAMKEKTEEDLAANYYLRKMRAMSADGAQWRKEQDEMDAGRDVVVLYGDR